MPFDRVPERLIDEDSVVIPAADSFAFHEAVGLQFLNDPLHRPLCDTNRQCHLTQDDVRVFVQQYQHMGVIRQERPAGFLMFPRCFFSSVRPLRLRSLFLLLSGG